MKPSKQSNPVPPLFTDNILDDTVEAIVCIDLNGVITFWNRGAESLYEYTAKEAIGQHFSVLYPAEQAAEEEKAHHFAPQVLSVKRHEIDGWRIRKSGEQVYIHLSTTPLLDSEGRHTGFIDYSIDITKRKQVEDALAERDAELRQQHMLYQALLEAQSGAGVGLFILENGKIAFANAAVSLLTGYSNEELLRMENFMLVANEEERGKILERHPHLLDGETFEGRFDFAIQTKGGDKRITEVAVTTIPGGDNAQMLVIMVDITERKNAEQRLQHLALHDSLTGLANRTLLFDRVGSTITAARRSRTTFALFYLDLDNFKPINDVFGHDAGDTALKIIADRLSSCVRESDTVARVGGDEFILVVRDVSGRKTAEAVAAKVIAALSEPLVIDKQKFQIGTSLGIALYPEHGADADTLMQHADAAMYTAKRLGKNRCVAWQG
jgi:diguanylate cyclase (GGDEF)-like protein/PAS domain S-box-containing protein